MREWLVIESAYKNCVFASDDAQKPHGYIPRDVAERLLGRSLGGSRTTWFTREDSDKMREHPEWSDTLPPGADRDPCHGPDDTTCPSCGLGATVITSAGD